MNLNKSNSILNLLIAFITLVISFNTFSSLFYINNLSRDLGIDTLRFYSWEDIIFLSFRNNIYFLLFPCITLFVILVIYIYKYFNLVKLHFKTIDKKQIIPIGLLLLVPLIALFFNPVDKSLKATAYIIYIFILIVIDICEKYKIKIWKGAFSVCMFCILACFVTIVLLSNNDSNNIKNIEFSYDSISNGVEKVNSDSLNYSLLINTSKGFVFADTSKTIYFFENERISNLKITTKEKTNN